MRLFEIIRDYSRCFPGKFFKTNFPVDKVYYFVVKFLLFLLYKSKNKYYCIPSPPSSIFFSFLKKNSLNFYFKRLSPQYVQQIINILETKTFNTALMFKICRASSNDNQSMLSYENFSPFSFMTNIVALGTTLFSSPWDHTIF